jgi:hypothetical protein
LPLLSPADGEEEEDQDSPAGGVEEEGELARRPVEWRRRRTNRLAGQWGGRGEGQIGSPAIGVEEEEEEEEQAPRPAG